MTKKNRKEKLVGALVTDQLYETVSMAAMREGMSISSFARECIVLRLLHLNYSREELLEKHAKDIERVWEKLSLSDPIDKEDYIQQKRTALMKGGLREETINEILERANL